ncbi:helix-turn-helix domain-containing protein [Flavobacterium aestivum]|uniref:helix-turn-helix domain-containing protein n=1 Tax=Flavobacterium aestivum TaxID=3003257 RepID=UPI002482BFEE|nr:helix-turn-helix domain-containing protein [Flavobacterium aestivum]
MAKLTKQIVPFGMVPNTLLNDNKISLKAKGLFAFMQSKPDGWNFSVDKIAFQCKEAKSSISEGLKELENFGYLIRKKQQTGNGFVVDYRLYFDNISDKPIADFQSLEIQSLKNPILGNPIIGKSVNNSNKDISKKDNSKKEERGDSLAFLENNYPSRFERLMMQFKNQITDFVKFSQLFEATVLQEKLEYDGDVLEGRFIKFAINWVSNQNKFDKPVIELNPNQKKEKIGGF